MANNKITVTDLEFDGIKANLKNYLSSQTQFQDYDFEGSGMDVLMDVLAYNTHYMGYYANMAVSMQLPIILPQQLLHQSFLLVVFIQLLIFLLKKVKFLINHIQLIWQIRLNDL